MHSSKWNYIGVGAGLVGALVGALTHSFLGLIIQLGLAMWNWYLAEAIRKREDELLIAFVKEGLKVEGDAE